MIPLVAAISDIDIPKRVPSALPSNVVAFDDETSLRFQIPIQPYAERDAGTKDWIYRCSELEWLVSSPGRGETLTRARQAWTNQLLVVVLDLVYARPFEQDAAWKSRWITALKVLDVPDFMAQEPLRRSAVQRRGKFGRIIAVDGAWSCVIRWDSGKKEAVRLDRMSESVRDLINNSRRFKATCYYSEVDGRLIAITGGEKHSKPESDLSSLEDIWRKLPVLDEDIEPQ
jgi:hypothetical protein